MKTKRLPPLNSLQAFEAAGRYESFLEAATEQSVTSGSVSRHVRLLESYLETELFVRRSNGVTLTSAGKQYAEEVSGIFRDLRTATDRVRKPSPDRAIVISTLPIFSERWLYRRIPSFRKAFGKAELRVECHNGEHDADRGRRGCVDSVFERTASRLQCHAAVRRRRFSRLQPAIPRDAVDPPQRRRNHRATPVARHILGHRLAGLGSCRRLQPRANLSPTCALRFTRASFKRRLTAWGWPSDIARWSPRSWRPESLSPCRISRLFPRNPIT